MKVLIFGATGSQQFNVIGAAKRKGAEVLATTHSQTNFPRLTKAGATPVLADMADANRIIEITKGVDAISFLIPASLPNPADGLQYARNVIDAARINHVKLIVWNTSGYLSPSKTGIPSEDVRLDVKEYFAQSGVPYSIIEPPLYAENLLAPYTVNYVQNQRKVAYPTPEQMPIGWICSEDVGALVAEALFKPELAGQSFQVSGLDNLNGTELAERFSIGLGEKITYYALPPKEFGDILRTFMHDEAATGIQQYYQSLATVSEYPSKYNPNMREVLEKLPVKMTPMEDWVKANRYIFLK
ncbi:SDR family oxidoreductase [Xanthocytophaga agilis]|uniref:NmrA family NAD(P)-binding protein n=1 Tax=Xanthocytophaga agilis TaxID=3048010 RepID=A0AAE3UGY4_9BACT|nr:NmrA family NAD(P)-binding protein [Xanthocytophaga agilis]MDJ1505468.1 NmrA family NAD(P)-binding protein [Xanthocytophaga agilis]